MAQNPKIEGEEAASEDVRIEISDLGITRIGLGPDVNLISASPAAIARLGAIGRAVLQKELPDMLDSNVVVEKSIFDSRLTHPKKIQAGRIRAALAQVLENDEAIQGAMVQVQPIEGAAPDALDDAISDNLTERAPGAPGTGLLTFLDAVRNNKLGTRQAKTYTLTPEEAIHLAWWADREAETDLVPFRQVGPFTVKWSKVAMIEMAASAKAQAWPFIFAQAVKYDAQENDTAALTILRQQVWPKDWTPEKKDLLPILREITDPAVRQEAAELIAKAVAGETIAGHLDEDTGPARRVAKKMGF